MEHVISVGGSRIWTDVRECRQEPKGTVLLCNGGPGCCDYLLPVARMLEEEYRVIRFEQRGCGRSSADGKYDLETTILDMEVIREYYGVSRWIVGGHSWGANLSLVYGMKYPHRTHKLLYICGNGIHNDRTWSEVYHKNLEHYGESIPPMPYPFNDGVNRLGNRTLRAFGRTPDFYRQVSKLNMKALFVLAEKDIRPRWPAEQLCCLMPAARLVEIKGASHFIWLEETNLQEVLLEFLAEE